MWRETTSIGNPAEKQKLQRLGLPEALAMSLRERILNGAFQPGEALVQERLAAEYDCSRRPIREAFRRREAEGLTETKVQKGAFVSSISPDEVMELFELRALIKCDMLRHSIPMMTQDDFRACAEILGDLEKVYTDRKMGLWGSLNAAFHKRLLLPAARVQSLIILGGINLQLERFVRLQLLLTEAFEAAPSAYQQLLALHKAGDAKRATPYLHNHILDAGTALVAAIKAKRKASRGLSGWRQT